MTTIFAQIVLKGWKEKRIDAYRGVLGACCCLWYGRAGGSGRGALLRSTRVLGHSHSHSHNHCSLLIYSPGRGPRGNRGRRTSDPPCRCVKFASSFLTMKARWVQVQFATPTVRILVRTPLKSRLTYSEFFDFFQLGSPLCPLRRKV